MAKMILCGWVFFFKYGSIFDFLLICSITCKINQRMRNVQGYEHVLVENTAERKDIDHAIREQFDVHIS